MPDQEDIETQTDINAERCVLGSMILSSDAVRAVLGKVKPEDFYLPVHEKLYQVLVEQFSAGLAIDYVSIISALADKKSPNGRGTFLEWVGGASYLHTLIRIVPTAVNASHYAEIVLDKAIRRRVIQAGIRIQQIGMQPSDGIGTDALLQHVNQEVGSIYRPSQSLVNGKSVLFEFMKHVKSRVKPTGVSTGFRDLDRLLGPLAPGRVMIVAGRPGQGKTVFACDIARHIAMRLAVRTVYVTLEMTSMEITSRNLSALSGVPHSHIRDMTITDAEIDKLAFHSAQLEEAPLDYWDYSSITLPELIGVLRLSGEKDTPPGVVIIDYINLLGANSKLTQRQEQVAEISRGIKVFARDLNCFVIALTQLNRGPEQRLDKRPQLSDLRESGTLEQDADYVAMVHRPDYYDRNDRPGEGDFMIVKNRHGETGTVPVAAQLHYMRFVDLAVDAVR